MELEPKLTKTDNISTKEDTSIQGFNKKNQLDSFIKNYIDIELRKNKFEVFFDFIFKNF